MGIVMSPRGGALAKLLPIFRFGLGGRIGSGTQFWNWIDLEDAAAGFVWLALNPTCTGPYNFVAESLRNNQFTTQIAECLGRPAWFPAPKWGLRLAMGKEKADVMLLSSSNVSNSKLLASQFRFRNPTLAESLSNSLGISRDIAH
jgi:NAD dependent epimerase/dehydratase family enzyme